MPRSARTLAAFVWTCLVLSALLHASAARADETAQRVESLKQRGNQAMLELNYADALAAYSAAIALSPNDAALYYNLGRAHQGREDYPAALDALDQFAKKASPETRARIPKLAQLVADVRSRVGIVLLECSAEIEEAVVAIGDKVTQRGCTRTPREVRVSVPSRRLTVEVRLTAEGYQAQSVRAAIEGGGRPTAVRLVALPKATSGTLLVRATPPDAVISVDDVVRGNPPLEVPLAAGAHALDIRAERHNSAHVPVVVEAGKTKDVSIDLQRAVPITSRWWFWTGVGVVVVGAGVAVWYVVAQPEGDASSGTIPPGQVSAPLVRF